MQPSQTRPSPPNQAQRTKAKPWPFLAPLHARTDADLVANARRVIEKTKAHLVEPNRA